MEATGGYCSLIVCGLPGKEPSLFSPWETKAGAGSPARRTERLTLRNEGKWIWLYPPLGFSAPVQIFERGRIDVSKNIRNLPSSGVCRLGG